MINRILIRIKAVQMLYSYLLTKMDFQILKEPVGTGRENAYAYRIYVDMLQIILELSGYRVGREISNPIEQLGQSNMLSENKLAKALASNSDLKAILAKDKFDIEAFNPLLLRLYSLITKSAIYLDYQKKKRHTLDDEVTFWTVILNTIVANNQMVIEAARSNEDFSIAGFQKGVQLAADTIRDYKNSLESLTSAKKALADSLDKAYELYHALLILPVAITKLEDERIEAAKLKYCPTDDELNPNLRFINNAYVKAIVENTYLEEYFKKHPFSWEADYYNLRDILTKIKESRIYKEYMESPETDFTNDCEFWRNILKTVVFPSDALAEALEQRSVYWNDDLVIMGTFVLKTIKQFGNTGRADSPLLPMYKDEEDARFGLELFMDAVKGRDTYRGYIEKFVNTGSWDSERLAFMDIVILTAAIAELLNFPSIPLAVTMNEYVEIANYYSTPRSGQFINGILFSIAGYLKEEGKLNK